MTKRLTLLSVVCGLCLGAMAGTPPTRSQVFPGLQKAVHPAAKAINKVQRQRPSDLRTIRSAQPATQSATAPELFYEVPFTHTLCKNKNDATNTTINTYYIAVDANNDGRTWTIAGLSSGSVCKTPNTNEVEAMDDWMISPAIHLKAGTTYRLSLQMASGLSKGKEEKLQIALGAEKTMYAMTTLLGDVAKATNGTKFVDITRDFTVEADGYYYFGFHALSEKEKSGMTKIKNFSIADKSQVVDPADAGTLTYTLAPKGELKATVTYTAPTKTVTGADLAAIDSVVVETNYKKTNTLTGIAPGQTQTFEVTLNKSAYNVIEATAYVKGKAGTACKTDKFYAGPDNPNPVKNLQIKLADDYRHVTLSWDPVSEEGENGGYVDVSKVTYYVFDAFGSIYDPAIATTTETSITLDLSKVKAQDFAAYQVTAGIDETYYSLATTSDIVIVGQPSALPFGESFANKSTAQPWLLDPETTDNGSLAGIIGDNELQTNMDDEGAEPEYLNSQDADNGFFYFLPQTTNAIYGIQSVKVDVSKAEKPVLDFHYQGKGSALDVLIAADGGPMETVKTIDLKENPTTGWTLGRVDLSGYKGYKYICFEFRLRAIHNTETTTWSVPLDNISLHDLASQDLRISAASAPATVNAGDSFTLKAYIENMGTEDCAKAEVTYTDNNGHTQTVSLTNIKAGTIVPATVTWATNAASSSKISYTVVVSAPNDTVAANNTATGTVSVQFNDYPTVTGLTGEVTKGGISLSWAAPDYAWRTQPYVSTEDFEDPNYPALTISDFGGWTLYDGDGQATYTFLLDTKNPYRTKPMAFQLYNPTAAGVPEEKLIDCTTHSGKQMLMAFSTKGRNDNWLISPTLPGDEQTISFWAKSFTIGTPESFEVLYSTTGTDINSFVKIDEVENYPENGVVPEDWTEYKAILPKGTTHFAIRHNSYDTYALMVDDITFKAAGDLPQDTELTGYNIYRNGQKVNDTPVSGTETTDRPAAYGTYAYSVSAVYNHGESQACQPITVDYTAATAISHVTGDATDQPLFNLQGQRVVRAGKGIYIKGGKKVLR